MKAYLKINPNDNVAIAVRDLEKDLKIEEFDLSLKEDIKRGHKFAIKDIKKGEDIVKYGMPIGHALADIKKGSWVHIHNLKTNLSDIISYDYDKKEV